MIFSESTKTKISETRIILYGIVWFSFLRILFVCCNLIDRSFRGISHLNSNVCSFRCDSYLQWQSINHRNNLYKCVWTAVFWSGLFTCWKTWLIRVRTGWKNKNTVYPKSIDTVSGFKCHYNACRLFATYKK